MIDLRSLAPIPHPAKAIFRRHGIPLSAVSKAVEKSYGYLSNILAGNQPATPELDAKLHELAASLENEAP